MKNEKKSKITSIIDIKGFPLDAVAISINVIDVFTDVSDLEGSLVFVQAIPASNHPMALGSKKKTNGQYH